MNSQVTARDELRQLIWQLIVDAWQENGVRLQARQDQPAEGGRDCQPLPMEGPPGRLPTTFARQRNGLKNLERGTNKVLAKT